MRRRGGWLVAILAVGTMLGALLLSLRPLFDRPTAVVVFWYGYDPVTARAVEVGIRQAVAEREGRAGGMNLVLRLGWDEVRKSVRGSGRYVEYVEVADEPELLAILRVGPIQQLLDPAWPVVVDVLGGDLRELPCPLADDAELARAALRWSKARGARRVAILQSRFDRRSADFAERYRKAAVEAGLEIVLQADVDAVTTSLVDRVVKAHPDLVFHGGESPAWKLTAELFTEFRNQGHRGPILTVDTSFWEFPQDRFPIPVEGVHVISALPGPRATSDGPPPREARAGYEAARIVLDAIDRAGRPDREAVRSAVLEDRRFGEKKAAPSMWIVRNNALEFVEEAP